MGINVHRVLLEPDISGLRDDSSLGHLQCDSRGEMFCCLLRVWYTWVEGDVHVYASRQAHEVK